MQKATVGGILTIVASVLGALFSVFLVAMPVMLNSLADTEASLDADAISLVSSVYVPMGVVGLVLGGLGLVGGIFAVQRKTWGLAAAGAIASSAIFYPLGIAAVVLVSMAYREFQRPEALPQTPQK